MTSELRRAFSHFPTGVAIVSTLSTQREPVGMTINSFTSVSLNPALLLWNIGLGSSNFAHFEACESFAVHILNRSQGELAKRFATSAISRFAEIPSEFGIEGALPILRDFLVLFRCTTYRRQVAGDHLMIIGEIETWEQRDGTPLVFARGAFTRVVDTAGPDDAARDSSSA